MNFKPQIFWIDKELVKKQIKIWTLDRTYKLIEEINTIELNIKKSSYNSINIIYDYILKICRKTSN